MTLLRRYGVVFWRLLEREADWLPSWRNLQRTCIEHWPLTGRSSFVLARYALFACILVLLGSSLSLFLVQYPPEAARHFFQSPRPQDSRHDYDYFNIVNSSIPHPIDTLIDDARSFHDARLLKQSTDVASAAQRYRERRGRHPPPSFERHR